VVLLAACATTATGRKQLTLMPDDELQAMGAQAFQDLKREKPIENDTATVQYVRCVARALAKQVDDEPDRWEVVVFEDETANAFALPGRHIGVYTGLLKVAKTPDQLAAVLGHEIAHVTQQHSNERVSQTFLAQGGLAAASVALKDGGSESRGLAMAALGLGVQYGVLMPFSRTQESEADVVGMDYMAKAGFDPKAAIELWRNMAAASKGKDAPPEFLSTHPSEASRIERLSKHLDGAREIYDEARESGEAPSCPLA
jgi:predicted Zn-dependent protease